MLLFRIKREGDVAGADAGFFQRGGSHGSKNGLQDPDQAAGSDTGLWPGGGSKSQDFVETHPHLASVLWIWVLLFWDKCGENESQQVPLSGSLSDSYQREVLSSQESAIEWCGKLGLGVKGGWVIIVMWGVDGIWVVWGRIHGNRDMGGEPGSLLVVYYISPRANILVPWSLGLTFICPVSKHLACACVPHTCQVTSVSLLAVPCEDHNLWLISRFLSNWSLHVECR